LSSGYLLYVEAPVYFAAVPHGRDDDDAGVIIDGIDHAVVSRAHAQVGPMARQGPETGRTRIDG